MRIVPRLVVALAITASMTSGAWAVGYSAPFAIPSMRAPVVGYGGVISALATDDGIPGVALPSSPVADDLAAGSDVDDVFRIHLEAHQRITCTLNGANGTDFDLYLYGPAATTLGDAPLLAAASDTYPESLQYTANGAGDYYVDVRTYSGSGIYQLQWNVETVAIAPDDDIPGVAAPASPITGTLDSAVDPDDVYSLYLMAGWTVSVSLSGDAGTDFDAYLYPPDATSVLGLAFIASATGTLYPDGFSYVVPTSGTYYLDVFSWEDVGAYSLSYTISQPNRAPVALADSWTTDEDQVLVKSAPGMLANDTDADGDALHATSVSAVSTGTLVVAASGATTYTPPPGFHGTATFTYRAADAALSSNLATVTITVASVNDKPVATGDAWATDEDQVLVKAAPGVLSNDTDSDGDPLTAHLVSTPSKGTLSLAASGAATYTPNPNVSGADSFTYRVYDGAIYSDPVTVAITIAAVADAPVALADSWAVDEDQVLVKSAPGMLTNDTDADGDALHTTSVSAVSTGTLVVAASGATTYTPPPGFHGTATFTYRAADAALSSNLATVTITVIHPNSEPIALPDGPYECDEDIPLTLAGPGILANDSDVDGTPLTAEKLSDPVHGSVTLGADGGFSYTPDANWNGTDSFSYRAYDGTAYSDTATVTVDVAPVNDAPVAAADSWSLNEGTTLTRAAPGVLANDTDIDGDPLTVTDVSAVSAGTLTVAPSGALDYTPPAGFHGVATFTYRASDGVLTSGPTNVTLTVAPVPSAVTFAVSSASKTLAKYGDTYLFAGTLVSGSTPLAGRQVVLQSASSPAGTFTDTALQVSTSASGGFSFSVIPREKTHYRARFAGEADEYLDATSASGYATPRHYVSVPKAPKSMSRSKYYTVYGSLKPRHSIGTKPVKIQCYKRNSAGVYKYHHSVYAKASDYYSYSKYKASVKLPHAGKWRVRAYAPGDSKHAYDYSNGYDYVTVK